MKKKKKSNPTTISLTAFLLQDNDTNLSPDEKESTTRLLIKSLLLEEECHKHKNRPYELPKTFCCIARACFELKEKSVEKYYTIHRIFLDCSKGNWGKISFFDISNTLAILLSATNNFPEDLKTHLHTMRTMLNNLDFLQYRYPHLVTAIFPKPSDENTLKKNVFLSLCASNKMNFLQENGISIVINKSSAFLENPYIP